MKFPRITFRRALFFGAVLLVLAGVAAPYFHADRFGRRIHRALEESLGRRVEMEDVRFNLFRGPGFSLRKVVIWDHPSVSIEPLAYVASIEARISLSSLWTGRLEFSSLRLVNPSVNLARTGSGAWNLQPVLGRASGAQIPEIHVRSGRLNFKSGDLKSVFYFRNADVDVVYTRGGAGPLEIEFSGEPARTDRATVAFGRLTGRGRWQAGPDGHGWLRLDMRLERSAIGELFAVLYGRDVGVHGWGAASVRIEGPAADLGIAGNLQLEEIHRWDLMPPYAQGGPLKFQGRLDLRSQDLRLETVPEINSALIVRFRATNLLSAPQWACSLTLRRLAIGPVLDVARHMGAAVPAEIVSEGGIDGVVGFSPGDGFQGSLDVPDARVQVPPGPAVRFRNARLLLDGQRIQLLSAAVGTDGGDEAELKGEFALGAGGVDLSIHAVKLGISRSASETGLLLATARLPLLDAFRGGSLAGKLRYQRTTNTAGQWSGSLGLRETTIAIPGIAEPLSVTSAKMEIHPGQVLLKDIRAEIAGATVTGEYHQAPGAKRPDRWHCRLSEIDAATVERLLMPSLRRERSFLSRTLGLGRPALPGWLEERHTEGILEMETFILADLRFESFKARVFWDAGRLEVTDFDAELRNGQANGHLSVDLRGFEPVFEAGARVRAMSWKGGRLDGDALIRSRGVGPQFGLNLRGEGSLDGSGIFAGPDLRLRNVSAEYELAWRRGQPMLAFRDVRLSTDKTVFIGKGSTQPDGLLRVDLSSGDENFRLSGGLFPLNLRLEPAR